MEADVTPAAGELAPRRVGETPQAAGQAGWRRVVVWVAEHELWLLAFVVPLLMSTNRVPRFLTVVALAVVPVGWLARKVAFGYFTLRTPLDLPIALLGVTVLVSLYASVDLETSLIGVHKIIAEVALFYGIVNGLRTPETVRWFGGLFLLVGLAAAVTSLLVMRQPGAKLPILSSLYGFLPTVIPRSVNANYIAGTIVLFLPLSLCTVLFNPRWLTRLVAAVVFLVLGTTLVLTQSRSALAGAVVALMLVAAWRNRWFLLGFPALAGAGWLLVQRVGIEQLIGPLAVMGTAVNSVQGRLELWQRAIYILQDFPYTGISIGTFDTVVDVLYPLFLIGPDTDVYHAHNLYLQTGVEFGLPGMVGYLAVLVAFVATTWAVVRNPRADWGLRVLSMGLLSGLVALLIFGFTDAIVVANKTGTFIWAAFGLAAAVYRLSVVHPPTMLNGESSMGWLRG